MVTCFWVVLSSFPLGLCMWDISGLDSWGKESLFGGDRIVVQILRQGPSHNHFTMKGQHIQKKCTWVIMSIRPAPDQRVRYYFFPPAFIDSRQGAKNLYLLMQVWMMCLTKSVTKKRKPEALSAYKWCRPPLCFGASLHIWLKLCLLHEAPCN